METAGPRALPADAFGALVRTHADRVHDRARRTGCGPAAALRVVEASALDLLAPAREGVPGDVLVGRWFATAAALAEAAGSGVPAPVSGDSRDALVTAALARRDERERTALLLTDAYDLPPQAVAAALGVRPQDVLPVVAQARRALLPDVFEGPPPPVACDPVAVARLATAPDDTDPAARHVRGCPACTQALQAQEDVRGLLAALPALPVPDAERESLLERVAVRARAALPAATGSVQVVPPARGLRPATALGALAVAALVGVALGLATGRPQPVRVAALRPLPEVVAPAPSPLAALPPASAVPAPAALPTTTVFTYPPTATPSARPSSPPRPVVPSTAPTPSRTPSASAAALTVTAVSGTAGRELRVTGTGWQPGQPVRLVLLGPGDDRAGPAVDVVADAAGALTGQLALGADAPPGDYRVRADQGGVRVTAPYTLSAAAGPGAA